MLLYSCVGSIGVELCCIGGIGWWFCGGFGGLGLWWGGGLDVGAL